MKGGDFMDRDDPEKQAAMENAIRRMEWEGAPVPVGDVFNPTINPDEGRDPDERQDPTHPLRRGRIRTGQ